MIVVVELVDENIESINSYKELGCATDAIKKEILDYCEENACDPNDINSDWKFFLYEVTEENTYYRITYIDVSEVEIEKTVTFCTIDNNRINNYLNKKSKN